MVLEFFLPEMKSGNLRLKIYLKKKTCINYLNEFLGPFTGMTESYYPSLPKIRFLSPVFFSDPFVQMPPK